MGLSADERGLVEDIAGRRDEIVELASSLIRFDTTARRPGDQPRDEASLQKLLADRFRAAGAAVEVWEPELPELAGLPLVPEHLDFTGRPQLTARFGGAGGGRSLLLNGHVDVVSAEPVELWTTGPNAPEVRDGRLYGRGACDMKGGIAAMVVAAEVVTRRSARLAGDLLVATNTDEESSGAGGMALVAHGVRADAGICPEPTGFDTWVACRGSTLLTIEVPGRPGHAEMPQPGWRHGGAVNAIEKAAVILDAIHELRAEWARRDDLSHPRLSPGGIVPTVVSGGEWDVTYPASCRLTCVVTYTPAHAASGHPWSAFVEREVAARIASAAERDDWLAEHPPVLTWSAGVMPMDLAGDEPIVATVLGAGADVGRPGRATGLDSWFDGATFTSFAETPTIAFGPSGLDGEQTVAHAVDEFVRVDDLVTCAQALALAVLRFCGPRT